MLAAMDCDSELIEKAMANFDPTNCESMRLIAAVNFVVQPKMVKIINELDVHSDKIKKIEMDVSELSDKIQKNESHNDEIQKNESDISILCSHLENVYFLGLDREVHDRKWSVLVDGVPGLMNESNSATRQKITSLSAEVFKNLNPNLHLKACHRLSQKADARIIVVFSDLDNRNHWFENAKNLSVYNQKYGTRIRICPDLPPTVRPLRNDIMMQRKTLKESSPGKVSRVQYLPRFPYVCLDVKDEPRKMPSLSKFDIMKKAMGT